VRTVADLSAVIASIVTVAIGHLAKRGLADPAWLDSIPPKGVRVPMSGNDGAVIVLNKHETREALVVSTVLD
jgi:hypothetical protein